MPLLGGHLTAAQKDVKQSSFETASETIKLKMLLKETLSLDLKKAK